MINTEFKDYKFGKNCASEFISECINKHVNHPEWLSKKQLKDIIKDKIIFCDSEIHDNYRVSFNTGYREVLNDFLTFITK